MSLERAQAALISEARSLGITVTGEVFDVGDHSVAERLKQALQLATVGEAAPRCTHLLHYALRAPQSAPFVYLLPFQGVHPLVGQYHFRLSGSLAAPAIYGRAGFLSKKWQTDNEPELADRLNNSPPLKKSIKQLPLQRHTTAGSIQLDWTVQIRALGDRTSHVIMQVGAGAFGDPYGAKLGACLSVANALTPLLTPEVVPEQGFWIEPAFWRLAFGDGLLGS